MNMQIAHTLPNRSAYCLRADAQILSDETLVRLIADGEHRAMNILFARHNVRVFRFALSIAKECSLAEDIVSEVFLEVWRRAGGYKGRSRVSTWLLAIVRHKSISYLRKRRHDQATEELAESIEDTSENPELAIQRKQVGSILADCLLQLPSIHREIIELVYYHQKTVKETAQVLEIPESTVKTRMFCARRYISAMLATTDDASVALPP